MVSKLELRADVQSIARFVKQQGPRIVHQGSRNQRSLGFARGHLCDRAIGEMGDAKPRQSFLHTRKMFSVGMMVRKNARAAKKTRKHHVAAGGIRGTGRDRKSTRLNSSHITI